MDKEDKHLDGAGLSKVWAKCKNYFLAKSGGTITGTLGVGGVTSQSYTLQVNGTFRASGNSSIGGTMTIDGNTAINGNLNSNATTNLNSSVNISGNTVIANNKSIGWLKNGGGNYGNVLSVNESNEVILGYSNNSTARTGIYGATVRLYAMNSEKVVVDTAGLTSYGGVAAMGIADLSIN